MPVAYAALLLALFATGCARAKPETPTAEPTSGVTPPATARPAAGKPTAPKAQQPVPARNAGTTAPPAAGKTASSAAKAPAAAPSLDLNALIERLKQTKAIGAFTKITLKNQVDDLLDQFRGHYQGKATRSMVELRRAYDLLMMKVLSLLQDDDHMLALAIVSSRESIWGLLSDPKKFATIDG